MESPTESPPRKAKPLTPDSLAAEGEGASGSSSGIAERLGGTWLLAPAIGYGASGEHQGFPGTVSIGTAEDIAAWKARKA